MDLNNEQPHNTQPPVTPVPPVSPLDSRVHAGEKVSISYNVLTRQMTSVNTPGKD